MTPPNLAILLTFWLLFSASLLYAKGWQHLRQKSKTDWALDLCGLCIQGILIPALQIGLLYQGLRYLIPQSENAIALSPIASFLLCTVLVDYGYYWNHRWLHARGWPIHFVHHTVTQLDILGTSRNSLWSSFFILYLWAHALILYLLKDPSGYLWGISLTAMLDLWRHSSLSPNPGKQFHRLLSPWLILPQDHAWHHAQQAQLQTAGCNFGANLKIWDRLHGTAKDISFPPKKLGIRTTLSLWQRLLYPLNTQ